MLRSNWNFIRFAIHVRLSEEFSRPDLVEKWVDWLSRCEEEKGGKVDGYMRGKEGRTERVERGGMGEERQGPMGQRERDAAGGEASVAQTGSKAPQPALPRDVPLRGIEIRKSRCVVTEVLR